MNILYAVRKKGVDMELGIYQAVEKNDVNGFKKVLQLSSIIEYFRIE